MRPLLLALSSVALLTVASPALAQDEVIRTGGTQYSAADAERSRRTLEALAYATPLPPGAPTADYSLVAWCEALVAGHVATGESLGTTDELDLRLIDLGRAEQVKFRAALDAGRAFQSTEALAEAEAAADGARRMWAPVLTGDQALRNETFGLFFGLPGRCEHAARRISLNITDAPPSLKDVGLE
ncbi:MAG TPA: hypothetical protein VGR32_01735 [Brevundimonas sp.]|jgi:hypothetical protein|uniref:hypothetical protein n=1 Tax=Brevundimonas sp. TaxID=1871086 RepID=UPI002DEA9B4B|nr:hypothetical protein [Brevundimonas sp.]